MRTKQDTACFLNCHWVLNKGRMNLKGKSWVELWRLNDLRLPASTLLVLLAMLRCLSHSGCCFTRSGHRCYSHQRVVLHRLVHRFWLQLLVLLQRLGLWVPFSTLGCPLQGRGQLVPSVSVLVRLAHTSVWSANDGSTYGDLFRC